MLLLVPLRMNESWISKRVAAARLGITPRQVLNLAKQHKLTSKRMPDPASRQMTTFLLESEVAEFRRRPRRAEVVATDYGRVRETELSTLIMRALRALGARLPAAADYEAPWLSVEQSAAVSGLPAPYLRSLIATGELPARLVGPGEYRVNRDELATLRGKTQH